MPTLRVRAAHVLPVDGPPVRDAVVHICDGLIREITPSNPHARCLDLGNTVLLPALINPHTHLEFSHLLTPLPVVERGFSEWIRALVQTRRELARDQSRSTEAVIVAGLLEVERSGSCLVGEIATSDRTLQNHRVMADVGVVQFRELLGLRPDAEEQLRKTTATWIQNGNQLQRSHPAWRYGISPHAPYSVSRNLLAEVATLSAQHHFPVAMHMAESQEELELLQSHSGPLQQLLAEANLWYPAAVPRGGTPWDYLQLLTQCPRTLIIHGNYLSPREWQFLGQHRDRMTVVYCPRTHHHFGHTPYPLEQMLAAGVQLAIGTDSRGSTPSLSLLDELRFAACAHPNVSPETILRMGTVEATQAMGTEGEFPGTLAVGAPARMIGVSLGDYDGDDPYYFLTEGGGEVVFPDPATRGTGADSAG